MRSFQHRETWLPSAVRICAGIAWPLATLAAISKLFFSKHAYHSATHQSLAAVTFMATACVGFALELRQANEWRLFLRATLGGVPGAVLIFALIVPVEVPGHISPFMRTLVAILTGAFSEEVVFRALLPAFLIRQLRASATSAIVAIATAQLVFAVAHGVGHDMTLRMPGPARLASLFVAGLLLNTLALDAGLGVAVGVHASINLSLAFPTILNVSSEWSARYAALLCAGAVIAVITVLRPASGRPTAVRELLLASRTMANGETAPETSPIRAAGSPPS